MGLLEFPIKGKGPSPHMTVCTINVHDVSAISDVVKLEHETEVLLLVLGQFPQSSEAMML